MTIKVFKGDQSLQSAALKRQQIVQQGTAPGGAPQQNIASNPQAAEAVVTNIKALNKNNPGEKIKDEGSASKAAERIAKAVRSDKGEALAAHSGLSADTAREYV